MWFLYEKKSGVVFWFVVLCGGWMCVVGGVLWVWGGWGGGGGADTKGVLQALQIGLVTLSLF